MAEERHERRGVADRLFGDAVRDDGKDGAAGRPGARRIRSYLPFLVIIVGAVFDILTPIRFTASPLYAAAPLVAAPFFTRSGTALVGLISICTEVALRVDDGTLDTVGTGSDLLTLVVVAALALGINRLVQLSGERLASARTIAEAAQRAVLPEPAERIGGLLIGARYEAAQEGALIGGDLFAVQDTPYGVRLVVGDVKGKGLGAVAAVAIVIGAFREAAEQERTLEGVAHRLDRALTRYGTRSNELDAVEAFTTAVLAEIPHSDDVVRLVNRGHPDPLVLRPGSEPEPLTPPEYALPLGMTGLGAWPDRADERPFPPGAALLFYTDGLSEARDAGGTFYDPCERLRGRGFGSPDDLLNTVIADVRLYTGGGSSDDMALLAVCRPVAVRTEHHARLAAPPVAS